MSLRSIVLTLLVLASLAGVAHASGREFIRPFETTGNSRYLILQEFGNRRRIAKLVEPKIIDLSAVRLLEQEKMSRDSVALVPKTGNRLRIARRIDASVVDLSGKVVIAAEPYGHERMILMDTFGNRNRLKKRVGPH
jgi:hypothetical protein